MDTVFLNGTFVPMRDAKVSVLDRGFLYGDGVFETMRAYGGSVFKLEEHVRRLLAALKIVRIPAPYGAASFSGHVKRAIRRNRAQEAYCKLMVTRGAGPTGIGIDYRQKPTVVIFVKPLGTMPEAIWHNGVRVDISRIRKNEYSVSSGLKTLNYLDNILARDRIRRDGCFEALLLNSKGYVAEGTTSNVFIRTKNKVLTPPGTEGLLPGITRQVVIGLLRRYFKTGIAERHISPSMLKGADEVFLTNSILEIVPVVRVGRRPIGQGVPGMLYKILHALYRREARGG